MVLCVDEESVKNLKRDGPTTIHAVIGRAYCLSTIIVVITKIDLIKKSEQNNKFEEIRSNMMSMLRKANWSDDNIIIIPLSITRAGSLNYNISNKFSWWDGLTFIEAFNSLKSKEKLLDLPPRMMITTRDYIKAIGIVIQGKVIAGSIKHGEIFIPNCDLKKSILSMESYHRPIFEANAGMNVGINIKPYEKHILNQIRCGDVCGIVNKNPPKICERFTANITVLHHPNQIKVGYSPVVSCGSAHVTCKIIDFISTHAIDGTIIECSPKFLKSGDRAIVEFTPMSSMVVEEYDNYPQLGVVIMRDLGIIIGIGKVISLGIVGRATKAAIRGNN